MSDLSSPWELLETLSKFSSPSGDEYEISRWIAEWISKLVPAAEIHRLGDNLIVTKGAAPQVAVFCHLDTTGFTLGYDSELIPIGGPSADEADLLRHVGGTSTAPFKPDTLHSDRPRLESELELPVGSRWVYAAPLEISNDIVRGPYLDNRAGLWAALQTLVSCDNIAIAFTTGEESSGHGAVLCGRTLSAEYNIHQAIIADITWHTTHVRCGKGPAISLRDSELPRRRFLDHVVKIAERFDLPYQIEVESSGGSDGTWLHSAGLPLDWVFVGAPEQFPHTSRETVVLADLWNMAQLLVFLVDSLHAEPLTDYPCRTRN